MRASLGSVILRVLTQSTSHPLPRKSKNVRAKLKSNDMSRLSLSATSDLATVLEVLVRMLLDLGDVFDFAIVLHIVWFAYHVSLCIGIDCLDKTTLIGVRDVPQSLVEFRGAAAHVCSQRNAITFDTPRLPRKQADPTPESPSNATKKCTRCADSDGAVQFRFLRPCLCPQKGWTTQIYLLQIQDHFSATVRPLAIPFFTEISCQTGVSDVSPCGNMACLPVSFWRTLSRRGHTHVLVLFGPRQFQIDLLYHGVAARVHCTQHLLDFDNCVLLSGTASDLLSQLYAGLRGRTPIGW